LAALILCVALVLPTAACLTPNSSRDDKLASGTIAGAAAGALIGYQLIGGGATGPWIAALVLGVAGGYAGYTVTDRLTLWDRQAMKETAYYSLTEAPAGETASWRNPDTGSNGTITPLRSYVDAEGRICRDYAATIYVEGENFDGQETACRNAVGAWVIG
jgi:surface antigen